MVDPPLQKDYNRCCAGIRRLDHDGSTRSARTRDLPAEQCPRWLMPASPAAELPVVRTLNRHSRAPLSYFGVCRTIRVPPGALALASGPLHRGLGRFSRSLAVRRLGASPGLPRSPAFPGLRRRKSDTAQSPKSCDSRRVPDLPDDAIGGRHSHAPDPPAPARTPCASIRRARGIGAVRGEFPIRIVAVARRRAWNPCGLRSAGYWASSPSSSARRVNSSEPVSVGAAGPIRKTCRPRSPAVRYADHPP